LNTLSNQVKGLLDLFNLSLVDREEMQMHLHYILVRTLPAAHLSKVIYGYNICLFIDYNIVRISPTFPWMNKS
jgi:hypothetical protein